MENKKLSASALAMIIFIAVFGFGNIANNFKEVGMSSATMFVLGALLFFLPFSLIMAEFGAYAKDRSAGIYSWIEIGLGKDAAYFAIWSYFVANIFYLPTLATRVPTYLSFFIYGDANVGNGPMAILAIVAMIAAVFAGIKYEKLFERISAWVGYLSLLVAFIFIAGGIYVYLFAEPSTLLTVDSFKIDLTNRTSISAFLGTFAWILFAFGGSEICGVYISDVDKPEKNFFRGLMLSSLLIAFFYVAGILAISAFGTAESFDGESLVNAVISGYKFMGDKLGLGMWFVRFIGFSYVLITVLALIMWSVALSKTVFSEVPVGTFPFWLTKKNKEGVLQNALIFQTVLAITFIVITNFGGDKASELYYKIYDMSTMAFLVPYFFLGLAYVNFRKHGYRSSFQVVKNNGLAMLLGSFIVLMIVIGMFFAGISIDKPIAEQIPTIELYYGGLFVFLMIGAPIKYIKKS